MAIRKYYLAIMIGFALIQSTNVSYASTILNESTKLNANDPVFESRLGYSVSLDGSKALVGAQGDSNAQEAAYIFDTLSGNQLLKLTPMNAIPNIEFGNSVGLSNNLAIVGAQNDDVGTVVNAGSAFLFDATTGEQLARITPPTPSIIGQFGLSVAIEGNIALVGSPDNGNGNGVFLYDVSDPRNPALVSTITKPDDGFTSNYFFGGALDISGDRIVVGSMFDQANGPSSGAAYLFDISNLSSPQLLHAKLFAPDGASNDRFGESVAIEGGLVVIGAEQNDTAGNNAGTAYVYDVATGQLVSQLFPSDQNDGQRFGSSVAISNSHIVVGSRYDNDQGGNSGSSYVFDTITREETLKLLPSDGRSSDLFGEAVAIWQDTAIIGARGDDDGAQRAGSAYLFTLPTAIPEPTAGVLQIVGLLFSSSSRYLRK